MKTNDADAGGYQGVRNGDDGMHIRSVTSVEPKQEVADRRTGEK